MIDPGAWAEANLLYLSAAVAWMRLCLEKRIDFLQRTAGTVLGREPSRSERQDPVSTPPSSDQLAKAADEMAKAESSMDPLPALVLLSRRFALSKFELNVLLLCAATEFDNSFSALCARAQGDANKTYPTFALALAIFDEPAWDALSPERPLARAPGRLDGTRCDSSGQVV